MTDLPAQFKRLTAGGQSEHMRLRLARTLTSYFVSFSEHHLLGLAPITCKIQTHGDRAPATSLHSMPLRVRAHYVKLLLNWTVSTLTKSDPRASTQGDSVDYLHILSSKWQLLFVLLTIVEISAHSAPNVTLVAAAAAACKGCSQQQASSGDGSKLALALQQAMLALNTKFKHSFRPSLEHSIALLGSVLAHVISCRHMAPPPTSLQAWEGLATQACIQLLGVCTSHPNQKKVFTAVVTTQLFLLLSQAIWQEPEASLIPHNGDRSTLAPTNVATVGVGRQSSSQLAAVSKQLLQAVMFHSSSMEGLIELSSSFPSSNNAGPALQTSAKGSIPRSYHSLLLQVIKEVLTDPSDTAAAATFMHLVSWLVSQFACTVKQIGQTSIEDASSTQHPQQHHPYLPSTAPVPLSADFYFAAILLQPLLAHMQGLDAHASDNEVGSQVEATAVLVHTAGAQKVMPKSRKGAKPNKQAAKETKGEPLPWEVAAKGAAVLVAAMQAGNVYRPTEDTAGQHRQLLTALANTVLQHAKHAMQAASTTVSSVQRQQDIVAACDVVSAILAVEHRAVQPHLADIWQLLWTAAQGKDGMEVATAVAAGLVRAYAELRQLQFLLQSLLEALLTQHPVTAAQVICTHSFVSALQKSVQEMPSGQAAPIIHFVVQHISTLASGFSSSPAQAAFGEVLASCLAHVRVEVVSASTLAGAVAELLHNSLAPALLPMLQRSALKNDSSAEGGTAPQRAQHELPATLNLNAQHAQQGTTAGLNVNAQRAQHEPTEAQPGREDLLEKQLYVCLLRLYNGAVKLYGQCAATQMQIEPLPGQATGLSTQHAPAAEQTGDNNGYFSALSPASQPDATLPSLPRLWQHQQPGQASSSSPALMNAQLTSCALQRIDTLHEQLLHKQYTCPLIHAETPDHAMLGPGLASDGPQTDGTAVEQPEAVSMGESQQADRQKDDPDDVEQIQLELRQLADQVLHFAMTALKEGVGIDGDGKERYRQQGRSECDRLTNLQTSHWGQVLDQLKLLAQHASDTPLQCFVGELLLCSCSTHSGNDQAASFPDWATATSTAAAAAAAVCDNPSFLEQPQLQRAWLHAVQARLTTYFKQAPVQSAGPDSLPDRHSNSHSHSKRRKSASGEAVTGTPQPEASHAAHSQLAQQMSQGAHSVQCFLTSRVLPQAGAGHSASDTHSKSSKVSRGAGQGVSQKRKASEPPSPAASLTGVHWGRMSALLKRVACMRLCLLTPHSASALAQLMLQAQLWLVQHAITLPSAPVSQLAATATATATATITAAAGAGPAAGAVGAARRTMPGATGGVKAGPLGVTACIPEGLLASHQVLAQCLKVAPDAAATAVLQAGPALWQWLPLGHQLTACLTDGLPGGGDVTLLHSVGKVQATGLQQSNIGGKRPRAMDSTGEELQAAASQQSNIVGERPRAMNRISEELLELSAACVQKLACYCLGVRQESAVAAGPEAAEAAGSVESCFEGFQAFVQLLSDKLQQLAKSKTGQPAGISRFQKPSDHDRKQLNRLLVTAEACLAAVCQADVAVVPKKQKKAAAEVVTGPVTLPQHQVQPQQLQNIVVPLEAAVRACMTSYITPSQPQQDLPDPVGTVRALPGATTSSVAALMADMDSTAVAALFSCAGHLLRLLGRSQRLAAARYAKLSHDSIAQQAQQAQQAQETAGNASGVSAANGSGISRMDVISSAQEDDLPWVLSSVTQQVAGLTHVLKLPWQLTSDIEPLLPGRLRLSVNSAHHIFGYLQAVAVALPRLDLQHGQTLWLPLLTLHIHAIATLSPILQAPLPMRHAGSAPMGVPTLVAPADALFRPFIALHKSLLLSLRDLFKNSSGEQQRQLYLELTQALAAAQSSTQALPHLEALLVALETPRDPRGLHLLARHSHGFASSLLLFLTKVPQTSSCGVPISTPADVQWQATQFPVNVADQGTPDGQQDRLPVDEVSPLQSRLAAMTQTAPLQARQTGPTDVSAVGMATSQPSAIASNQRTDFSRAQHSKQLRQDCIHLAAAVATAHRCLESVLARESVFTPPPNQVAQALFSPAVVFSAALDDRRRGVGWGVTQGAGVFMGCCSLLMAGLRHHAGAVRRCMALVGASTRALLQMLMHWFQLQPRIESEEGLLVVCSTELAQLYTTIAADKAGLGKYCVHLLADYITCAAAPTLHITSTQPAATSLPANTELEDREALAGAPAAALRQGALALYGACSPAEVQHIHASLSGASGGMQRTALADLRHDYEADYRYTGKV